MGLGCIHGGHECSGCGACETPKKYCDCDHCGEPIYEGDTFYLVECSPVCSECMEKARRTA